MNQRQIDYILRTLVIRQGDIEQVTGGLMSKTVAPVEGVARHHNRLELNIYLPLSNLDAELFRRQLEALK